MPTTLSITPLASPQPVNTSGYGLWLDHLRRDYNIADTMNLTQESLHAELACLPVYRQEHFPALIAPPRPVLKEQLIRLLATSYVRREGRFFHIDRPSEPLSRDDLQRSFLYEAQRTCNGAAMCQAARR